MNISINGSPGLKFPYHDPMLRLHQAKKDKVQQWIMHAVFLTASFYTLLPLWSLYYDRFVLKRSSV